MYEHNALGYWSRLALCLTKSEAVEHAVLRQLLSVYCLSRSLVCKCFLCDTTKRSLAQKCSDWKPGGLGSKLQQRADCFTVGCCQIIPASSHCSM